MSGASFNERAVVLRYLLKEKVIKNVIYSLDSHHFTFMRETSSFDFLYIDDSIRNIRIYFNPRFITCALKWSLDSKCVGKKYDIYKDSISFWEHDYLEYFGGMQKYLKDSKNIEEIQESLKPKENTESKKENAKKIINENILDIVKNNPQTQFYFIVPTYSRLFYKLKGQEYFEGWKENISYFINTSENLSNVTIYGFDDLSYADNIANYKDSAHYNTDMNFMQLEAIANKTHILDSKNIESYLNTMQEKIKKYDISPFINEIKLLEK